MCLWQHSSLITLIIWAGSKGSSSLPHVYLDGHAFLPSLLSLISCARPPRRMSSCRRPSMARNGLNGTR